MWPSAMKNQLIRGKQKMASIACPAMVLTCQLLAPLIICVDTVLATNHSDYCDPTTRSVPFCLLEQLVNLWITRMHKSPFETYAFIINHLIKHVDAKAYNRHVVTGQMKPGELLSVAGPGSSWLVAIGELSGTVGAACEYTNPGNKRDPWSKEGYKWYNVLHEEICQDQLLVEGRKLEGDFQKMMLAQAGKTTSRKRKAVTMVEVAVVHDLDSDSDNDEYSGICGAGTANTISKLSSHGTEQGRPV